MFENKTLQAKNPFKVLQSEQKECDFDLDFRILDFNTFGIKQNPPRSKNYPRTDLEVFYSDDFFVKNYDTIHQEFKIEIFPKTNENPFKFTLGTNANLTLIKARLNYEKIDSNLNINHHLKQALYKTLIKHKILILRLDRDLETNLDKCIALLKEDKADGFEFIAARGVSEIPHQNAKLIFHRNTKVEMSESRTYDERQYSQPVQKDELLFEYMYRKLGKIGRNLRGELLKIEPLEEELNAIKLKDDSIYTEELEDRIQYFSANYGFLTKDIEGFSVNNSLKVSKVDLKNTGSIKTDLDEEINVEVSNKNFNDDAVKSGIVNIKAANVNIEGHVGATELKAAKLQISGATHAKSKIYAQSAFIANHKGFFEGDVVFINNLEQGEIKAKNVYVKRCIASKIEADNIFIEDLFMDNKLYPKKNLIILKNIKANNRIKVSPEVCFTINKCEDETKELKALFAKINIKLTTLLKQKQNFYTYLVTNQAKVIKLKKNKYANQVDTKIIEIYEDILQRYQVSVVKYKKLVALKYETKRRLESLENMIFKVKIYIQAEIKEEDNILEFDGVKNTYLELKKQGLYRLKEKGIECEEKYDESEIETLKAPFLEFLQEDS
ncbi:FapA family protein [Campylobacter upsaliensis]|uniref:flagellar assembly protein A n=1 Tax=Campylobacter upsaliensis TaxID=28080 RepID=UPI002B3B5172|nr:flagellar assembly protein A [Campylobacter upsaliensis]MEB2822532.1 FapA family protein [Campylobacter upsaliensis]